MKQIIKAILILFIAVQSYSVLANEPLGSLYRYKDKSGNQIVNNVLPPEYANKGYEVLSSRGNVIKKVPPKRTPEEIQAAKEAEQKKQIAAAQAREAKARATEQAREDDILLKSFSSEQDIKNSRDRKISSIEILENITKEHIQQLNRQLEEARSAAANYERMGRAIPENVFKAIEESKRQILENQEFMKVKYQEKATILDKFEKNLSRFRALKAQESAKTIIEQ